MNEERKMILQMLKEGTIDVEEAERLLEALSYNGGGPDNAAGTENTVALPGGVSPKRLFVLVSENGRNKVNVRIPFSLVRAGLKLGKTFGSMSARYVEDPAGAEAMNMLRDIDIDEISAALDDGEITLPYVMVDVDDEEKGQQVRVILE